jgi:drug/metabolite transporter (DMT)-like permease
VLTYLLAVLASGANATASVLQRKANLQVPRKQNLSPRLIWSLLHEPVWFGGVLAVFAGFLLQASALGSGQISVVEPILVLELPMTLLLASRMFRAPMRGREWAATAAMSAALAALLYCLSPSGGRPGSVPWYAWIAGIGANLALVAVMVAWGRRGPAGRGREDGQSSAHQAAVLGVAAGSAFGLTAALMKGMTSNFSRGIGTLLVSWQLYGMIAAGVLAMFLLQSAVNAGRLIAAQPALTLANPIVAVLWGVAVFGERVRGGWFILPIVLSGLIMAAAVVALARSPLLARESAGTAGREHGGRVRAAHRAARPG